MSASTAKQRALASLLAVMMVGLLPTGSALGASPDVLIAQATTRAQSGGDARAALDALLSALTESRDEDAIGDLLDAIESLGDADGTSPQAVKQYLRTKAPPVLRRVFGRELQWTVRSDALMLHRTLEAGDADLREAIALAMADTSPQREFMQSRGELLQDWLDQRTPERRTELDAAPAATVAPDSERQALAEARALGIGVNVDALMDAARRGSVGEVRVLLEAGLDVNARSSAWISPLAAAAYGNCTGPGVDLRGNLDVMDELFARGAHPDAFDERGNSILMPAVQQCPLAIVRRLLDAGAQSGPVNKQDFTPLEMALVLGKIDIAELLVERGARRDPAKLDRIFAETPDDARLRDLLKRAAAKGK